MPSSMHVLNGVPVALDGNSPLDVARLASALQGGVAPALPTPDAVGTGGNDLPGDDDPRTPRPLGSRRLVTVTNQTSSVAVRVYESEVALPQTRARCASQMLARGWRGGGVQTDEALGFWSDRADVVVAFAETSREGVQFTRTTVAILAR
jgi:hypothetical protein